MLGGWNQDHMKQATLLKINDGKCEEDQTKKIELNANDFFTGGEVVAHKEDYAIVSGMKGLHALEMKTLTFNFKQF